MTEDQILLKLIIQGQDPAEIQRLAASTQGQLNDRIRGYLDQLTQLHRQAAQAQTDEAVSAIKQQIDAAEKQVDTVNKVMRANEIAANRMSSGWRRTLEDIENLTVASFGVKAAWDGISGKAHQLGDEIDKLTNVYGSLKGSIDEMREASKGEISDFDLITTKNRALEKDLQLTDKQFGIVARAADNFADSIGVSTKEALDQLIDGLATGRLKTLAHAGVIIDAKEAQDRFAASIGTTADQLNDEGKRIAVVQEALRLMDEKNRKSGEVVDDFSHRWEKMTAQAKNFSDVIKLHVGEAIVFVMEQLDKATTKLSDFLFRSDVGVLGKRYSDSDLAKLQGNFKREITPDDFLRTQKYEGNVGDLIKKPDAAAIQRALDAQAKFNDQFQQMLLGGKQERDTSLGYDSTVGKTPILDEILGQIGGIGHPNDLQGNELDRTAQAELEKLAGATPGADKVKGESLEEQVNRFEKEFIAPLKQKTVQYEAELEATKQRAGGGLFSVLLFGPDGPDKTYEEMDALQKATVDMAGTISDAMIKMAEAVGAQMANWIANSQGARKSFQDVTHDLLIALSTKAFVKGLEELAEAAGSIASYDYSGAALHAEAAAAWGALGAATGIAARVVGQSSSATASKSSSTSRPTTSLGSGNIGSSSSSSGQAPQIIINVNAAPGGEAEAGRQVYKALKAYAAEGGNINIGTTN